MKFYPEQKVGGGWQRIPGVYSTSLAGVKRVLAARFPISANRAAAARQPHEATVRVVDERGTVYWPMVLKEYP